MNALVVLLVALSAAHAQESAPSLTSEERDAFTLLDDLGFPKLDGLRYGHVIDGDGDNYRLEPPCSFFRRGFLLADDAESFKVWLIDFTTPTFRKLVPGKKPLPFAHAGRMRFEPADLAESAESFLADLKAGRGPGDFLAPDRTLRCRSQALVLAYACSKRGLLDLCHRLCAGATTGKWLQSFLGRHATYWELSQLARIVAVDFEVSFRHQTTLAFADIDLDRRGILARHRFFLEHFPRAAARVDVESTAAMLEAMIAEDDLRAATSRPTASQPAERAKELVHALRDEASRPNMGVHDLDLPDCYGEWVDVGPAHELDLLGFEAVPALIEAVGDLRPARQVGYSSRRGGSLTLVSIGELAVELLERIAARPFQPESTEAASDRVVYWAQYRASIEAWWEKARRVSEAEVLSDAVALGGPHADRALRRLVGRKLSLTSEAVRRGLGATTKPSDRSSFLATIGVLPDAVCVPLLKEELLTGTDAVCRLEAAKQLRRRGDAEALDVVLVMWRDFAKSGPMDDAATTRADDVPPKGFSDALFAGIGGGDPFAQFAELLLNSGDPRAVASFADDIGRQSPWNRRAAILDARSLKLQETGSAAGGPTSRSLSGDALKCADLVETMLIELLDDGWAPSSSEGYGLRSPGRPRSEELVDPRNSDLAGVALQHLFPERYAFDGRASIAKRDRAIAEMKDVWRRR